MSRLFAVLFGVLAIGGVQRCEADPPPPAVHPHGVRVTGDVEVIGGTVKIDGVPIAGASFGTTSADSYRGDWGGAVSNIAAAAYPGAFGVASSNLATLAYNLAVVASNLAFFALHNATDLTARAWAQASSNLAVVASNAAAAAQATASAAFPSTGGSVLGILIVTNTDTGHSIEIKPTGGEQSDASIRWIRSPDAFPFTSAYSVLSTDSGGEQPQWANADGAFRIWTSQNDGGGSGLDADAIAGNSIADLVTLNVFQDSHAMTNTVRMIQAPGTFTYLVISNMAAGGLTTTQRLERAYVQ